MSEQKLQALSESQLEAKTSTRRVVNLLSGSIAFEFWWSASSIATKDTQQGDKYLPRFSLFSSALPASRVAW